jgi:hypothetical protein
MASCRMLRAERLPKAHSATVVVRNAGCCAAHVVSPRGVSPRGDMYECRKQNKHTAVLQNIDRSSLVHIFCHSLGACIMILTVGARMA